MTSNDDTNIPPENEKSESEDDIGLHDFLEATLTTFDLPHDWGSISKVALRIVQSGLKPDEYGDFITARASRLEVRISEGEISEQRALSYFASPKAIKWFREDKQTNGESKGYKTDVGKNDFDAPEADIEKPESNEADDPFPDKSDLELVQTAIEINEDPEQFRPGVLDRIDWAEIDDSLDVPDHLHKRGA